MRRIRATWVVAAVVLAVGGLAVLAEQKAEKAKTDRSDVLYTCGCGPDCKCDSARLSPGECKCGEPLVWGHVVRVDSDTAMVCACKEGCSCKADPKDAKMCGCGHALKPVSLKGTGIYFCNCGGSCTCNFLSDRPGKCKCGMELKKAA